LKGDYLRRSGCKAPHGSDDGGLCGFVRSAHFRAGVGQWVVISAESNTIFRGARRRTTGSSTRFMSTCGFRGRIRPGRRGRFPSTSGVGDGVDLGDKSTDSRTDGDFQYGYLSYRGNKSNFLVNGGRQFVAEGVAAERIDGLYLRSDLVAGFGAAVFCRFAGGSPRKRAFKGGDILYGGRITHSMPKYYTVGLKRGKDRLWGQPDPGGGGGGSLASSF